MVENLQQMHLKLVKKESLKKKKKTAQATGDLIANKIANKITWVSNNLQQNNSEIATNQHDKEIPEKRYISPEERQETVTNENDKEIPK